MSRDLDDYKSAVRNAAPAPYNETEGYERFSAWFMPLAFGAAIALCYILAWANLDGTLINAARLSEIFPPANGRIDFFERQDEASKGAYTATLSAGLLIVPAFLVSHGIGYWSTVVAPGRCRRVSRLTIMSVLTAVLAFVAIFWIGFFFVPDVRLAKKSFILFWPIFPALGGVLLVLISHVVFGALVGGLKFLFGLRGKNC